LSPPRSGAGEECFNIGQCGKYLTV